MNHKKLILVLEQKINLLYQQYNLPLEQKINTNFDRTLFSESFETFGFYMSEIETTLSKIKSLNNDDILQCQFYCQKLVLQCKVLDEAIYKCKDFSLSSNATKQQRQLFQSQKEKVKTQINALPPRERLNKYYEFLALLDQKIVAQKDKLYQASQIQEKQVIAEQIRITKQRKNKCLEAIKALKEYLVFKEASEQK